MKKIYSDTNIEPKKIFIIGSILLLIDDKKIIQNKTFSVQKLDVYPCKKV